MQYLYLYTERLTTHKETKSKILCLNFSYMTEQILTGNGEVLDEPQSVPTSTSAALSQTAAEATRPSTCSPSLSNYHSVTDATGEVKGDQDLCGGLC